MKAALVLAVAAGVVHAQPSNQIQIVPNTGTVAVGDSMTVNVLVDASSFAAPATLLVWASELRGSSNIEFVDIRLSATLGAFSAGSARYENQSELPTGQSALLLTLIPSIAGVPFDGPVALFQVDLAFTAPGTATLVMSDFGVDDATGGTFSATVISSGLTPLFGSINAGSPVRDFLLTGGDAQFAVVGDSSPADFNGDSVIDIFDLVDFITDYAALRPAAEFNGDGVIDIFDLIDFIVAFASA